MSISNNSINYGDNFTPAANGEVNGDAVNLDNDGQFDGKNSETPIIDQQQLKEFREKFAKMEMELKMAKLELENKEQKLKLHEMMVEQKALKEKMAKIEQKNEKNATSDQLSEMQNDQKILEKISELEKQQKEQSKATGDQFSKIIEKISKMEKQQKEQTKANSDQLSTILEKISELEKKQKQQPNENTSKDQLSEMQNDQKIILEKISEFEKEQRQRKALLNFRQNYWDANVCDERLEIIGNKKLIVHYKGHAFGSCSVFAKHPILLNNNSPDIFYFEISIGNKETFMFFGFAVKQQTKLYGYEKGTYAYESDGCVWINGERKRINAQYSYCSGDTVGIGINSATRQIICTKNGLRLGPSYFPVAPFFADDLLYPFVSLEHSGDQIEANFVPIFKFDLKTL
ncbi:hypothetical protein niasHT_000584 [Heterodera trifolii]|uniref:B30.2/SPRY domain-containing protein n=1 Tax=Heterodera trifolii TaxID=157864 RepID=A0ABD2LYZ9_9BILA